MSIKLYYFQVQGRAEAARMLMKDAGVDFENEFIDQDSWPKMKADVAPLFGQVPVMTVDNERIAQSQSIIRFLARKYGYNGSSESEATLIDQLNEHLGDIRAGIKYVLILGSDAEASKKFLQDFPALLKPFVQQLQSSKSGYLVGSKPSYIDFNLFVLVNSVLKSLRPDSIKDKAPAPAPAPLQKFIETMKNRPNISAYLSSEEFQRLPAMPPALLEKLKDME